MSKLKNITQGSYQTNSSEIYNKMLEEEGEQLLTFQEQTEESSKQEEADNHTVEMVIDFGDNRSSSLLIG